METPTHITLGSQRLVAAAQARGWKAADLAAEFGCSAVHAWRLLSGRQKPGDELRLMMADRLGIDLRDWLEPAQKDAA